MQVYREAIVWANQTRAPVLGGMKGDEDKALMLSYYSHFPIEGQERAPQMPERTSAVQGPQVSSSTTRKAVFHVPTWICALEASEVPHPVQPVQQGCWEEDV